MGAKINLSYAQKFKTVFHTIQGIIIFIAFFMGISILTKAGSSDGRAVFFVILCVFTAPALIYQTMTPMWPRAQRFANMYAFAGIDLGFAILWFAAFITLQTWVAAGIAAGNSATNLTDEQKKALATNGPTCAAFAFGSTTKCRLGRANVGLGAGVSVFFFLTAAISAYGIRYFKKEGRSMWDASHKRDVENIEVHTKDAFSGHDEDEHHYGQVDDHEQDHDDAYRPLHRDMDMDEHEHVDERVGARDDPFADGKRSPYDEDTSYGGANGNHRASLRQDPFADGAGRHQRYGDGGRDY